MSYTVTLAALDAGLKVWALPRLVVRRVAILADTVRAVVNFMQSATQRTAVRAHFGTIVTLMSWFSTEMAK